jgi:hypothetical protein
MNIEYFHASKFGNGMASPGSTPRRFWTSWRTGGAGGDCAAVSGRLMIKLLRRLATLPLDGRLHLRDAVPVLRCRAGQPICGKGVTLTRSASRRIRVIPARL